MSSDVVAHPKHFVHYRTTQKEQIRTADLRRLLPPAETCLEIGPYDGHFTRILAKQYPRVTALDLQMPAFSIPGVEKVVGDVTRMQFDDASFDIVVCTEVLEHVAAIEQAAEEIARVAKRHVLIGVPYRHDIRVGRATCQACGHINPPHGHVNSLDEGALKWLFSSLKPVTVSHVHEHIWGSPGPHSTNALASRLMDRAGNPWGIYGQPCLRCGVVTERPAHYSRITAGIAQRLAKISRPRPKANWVHVLFEKQ